MHFHGKKGVQFCDGLTRRDFLKVGALSAGAVGLSLADLHQASASAGSRAINCILLFLVGAGRLVEAQGEVNGAARDAARAASVARSLGAAQLAADQAVRTDVRGMCGRPVVQGYQPGSTAVVVTLRCQLDLSFVGYATLSVNGYAVAPLDQFVARTY